MKTCYMNEPTIKAQILYDYLYETSRIGKFVETESRLILLGAGKQGNVDWLLNVYGVLGDMIKMFGNYKLVTIAQ